MSYISFEEKGSCFSLSHRLYLFEANNEFKTENDIKTYLENPQNREKAKGTSIKVYSRWLNWIGIGWCLKKLGYAKEAAITNSSNGIKWVLTNWESHKKEIARLKEVSNQSKEKFVDRMDASYTSHKNAKYVRDDLDAIEKELGERLEKANTALRTPSVTTDSLSQSPFILPNIVSSVLNSIIKKTERENPPGEETVTSTSNNERQNVSGSVSSNSEAQPIVSHVELQPSVKTAPNNQSAPITVNILPVPTEQLAPSKATIDEPVAATNATVKQNAPLQGLVAAPSLEVATPNKPPTHPPSPVAPAIVTVKQPALPQGPVAPAKVAVQQTAPLQEQVATPALETATPNKQPAPPQVPVASANVTVKQPAPSQGPVESAHVTVKQPTTLQVVVAAPALETATPNKQPAPPQGPVAPANVAVKQPATAPALETAAPNKQPALPQEPVASANVTVKQPTPQVVVAAPVLETAAPNKQPAPPQGPVVPANVTVKQTATPQVVFAAQVAPNQPAFPNTPVAATNAAVQPLPKPLAERNVIQQPPTPANLPLLPQKEDPKNNDGGMLAEKHLYGKTIQELVQESTPESLLQILQHVLMKRALRDEELDGWYAILEGLLKKPIQVNPTMITTLLACDFKIYPKLLHLFLDQFTGCISDDTMKEFLRRRELYSVSLSDQERYNLYDKVSAKSDMKSLGNPLWHLGNGFDDLTNKNKEQQAIANLFKYIAKKTKEADLWVYSSGYPCDDVLSIKGFDPSLLQEYAPKPKPRIETLDPEERERARKRLAEIINNPQIIHERILACLPLLVKDNHVTIEKAFEAIDLYVKLNPQCLYQQIVDGKLLLLPTANLEDQIKYVQYLLDKGFRLEPFDVMLSMQKYDNRITKALIKHLDPRRINQLMQYGLHKYSHTLLHEASRLKNYEIYDLLLKKGADDSIRDADKGYTPLHYVAENSNLTWNQIKPYVSMQVIVSAKPNQNARVQNRCTPMDLLIKRGITEDQIVDALKENKQKFKFPDRSNEFCLGFTAERHNVRVRNLFYDDYFDLKKEFQR